MPDYSTFILLWETFLSAVLEDGWLGRSRLLLAIHNSCYKGLSIAVRAVTSAVTLLAFAVTAFFSCHHYQNCLWPLDVCQFDVDSKFHAQNSWQNSWRSMWSVRTTACEVPLPHSKPHNCLRVHFKVKCKADKCYLKNSGSGLSSGSCLCQCCAYV